MEAPASVEIQAPPPVGLASKPMYTALVGGVTRKRLGTSMNLLAASCWSHVKGKRILLAATSFSFSWVEGGEQAAAQIIMLNGRSAGMIPAIHDAKPANDLSSSLLALGVACNRDARLGEGQFVLNPPGGAGRGGGKPRWEVVGLGGPRPLKLNVRSGGGVLWSQGGMGMLKTRGIF